MATKRGRETPHLSPWNCMLDYRYSEWMQKERLMATRVAIYARVSTDDKGQDPENQLRQLRAWCERMGYPVVREYVEHENGGRGVEYRKALAEVFAGAARREFDLLLVWS